MPLTESRTFCIHHSNCDAFERLRPSGYLRLMQEAAFDASAAAGYDLDAYRELDHNWLIRETDVEFLRPARYGDEVIVTTYVKDFRRIRSQRAYELRDAASGEMMAQAVTDWVYLDMSTGRPAPIPDEMKVAFFPEGPPDEAAPRERFPSAPKPESGVFGMRRRVRWSDIDAMAHVNNAAYVTFVVDAHMERLAEGGWTLKRMLEQGVVATPRRLRIEYRVPALLDDLLRVAAWPDGDDVHYTLVRQADGELLARAVGSWLWTNAETGEMVEVAA
jgi:acyl-CoA thioester hydrolase